MTSLLTEIFITKNAFSQRKDFLNKEISIEAIKMDENLLCSLEFKRLQVMIYLIYQGSDYLKYYLFYKGKILFHGDHFRPSSMYAIDSLNSIKDLLSWLILKKGDVNKEYFKEYTEDQLKFTESKENQALTILYNDYDIGENKRLRNYYKSY